MKNGDLSKWYKVKRMRLNENYILKNICSTLLLNFRFLAYLLTFIKYIPRILKMKKIECKNSSKTQCVICIIYFMVTNYSEVDSLEKGSLQEYIVSIYQCRNLKIMKRIEP